MRNRVHKLFSFLGTFVLGVLGFTSCGETIDGPILCEYGTPSGKFNVDIKVTDESGKPLKDISVSPVLLHAPNFDIRRQVLETIKTDASGKASRTYDNWWVDDVRVIFEDESGVLHFNREAVGQVTVTETTIEGTEESPTEKKSSLYGHLCCESGY